MKLDIDAIKHFLEIRERLKESGVFGLSVWTDKIQVGLDSLSSVENLKVEEREDEEYPYLVTAVIDGIELFALATSERLIDFFERRGKGETV